MCANAGSPVSLPNAKWYAKRPADLYDAASCHASVRKNASLTDHGLAQRDRSQPQRFDAIEHARQDVEDDRRAGCGSRRVAVVKQEDVPGGQAVEQPRCDFAASPLSVSNPRRVQLDEAQPHRVQHRIEQRVAQTRGRTEEARRDDPQARRGSTARARSPHEARSCRAARRSAGACANGSRSHARGTQSAGRERGVARRGPQCRKTSHELRAHRAGRGPSG